jgi:hypothetical protein
MVPRTRWTSLATKKQAEGRWTEAIIDVGNADIDQHREDSKQKREMLE